MAHGHSEGRALLLIAAVLWFIWGAVHMLAGVVIITSDASGAVAAVADAVDPAAVQMNYHAAAGALINQHGFNLLWIGFVTLVCAIAIARRSASAIGLAALVGGLADIGYFVFLDLGGFVNFVPGTLMTLFSSAAIATSGYVYFKHLKS